MKKIYITGIAGLLGANLAQELKKSYEITGSDLIENSQVIVKYDVFDLLDFERLRNSIQKSCPDILIHTAAMVNMDNCEHEPEHAHIMNYLLTEKLVEICAMNNIKLVYISTDAVFDGKKRGLYSEVDLPAPLSIYGKTKLKGEQSVLRYSSGLVLRTNIYGINVQNKYSFGEWIVNALLQGETINMFDDIHFSPILVNDLACVIDKALKADLCGVYHACGSGDITKYEFGVRVKEIFRIQTGKINKTTSDKGTFFAPRTQNMGMSNLKISAELEMTLPTPEESIRHFYQVYQKRGK